MASESTEGTEHRQLVSNQHVSELQTHEVSQHHSNAIVLSISHLFEASCLNSDA